MRFPRLLRLPVSQAARIILSTSVIALLGYATSRATDLYWDSDGTTAGGSSSTTAPGTWGTGGSLFWNSDPTGGGAGTFTDTTLNTSDLHFSAGTDVTGSSTVTVSGAQVANSIIFEEGSITLSGGTSITLGGGGGGNTGLFFLNGTVTNTISTAIVLASDAAFTNSDNNAQTISGGVTGTANLALNVNSTGTLTLSTGNINNAGTITNSGTGTATTTISGVIGANVTGIIQNSLTSALALSGANTAFTGPVTIQAGTITVSTASALGTGIVTLGDVTGGSNPASLVSSASVTIANPIVLASNTTGTLTIGNSGSTTAPAFTGGVTGNNNLTINTGASAGGITFSTGAINNVGTVTHTGPSTGTLTINSLIGSNVTQVIQNSTNSAMNLANGSNAFGALLIKAGNVQISQNTAGQLSAGGVGPITLGDSIGSAAATLSGQGTQATFSNPIFLGGTSGLLTIRAVNSATPEIFTGGITGTNNVTLQSGTGTATLNFTTNPLNNAGTITNGTVTGTGAVNITAVIGANVTGVIQNSATSRLVLNNAEAYNGATTATLGTLELATGGSLAGSAVSVAAGATFLVSGTATIGTSGNGSVTVAGGPTTTGGTLSLANNAINTLTINSATPGATVLTLGDASGSSQLNFEVGSTADQIVLGNGLLASIGAGGVTVNVNGLGLLNGTTQTLISAPGGGLNTGGGFTLNAASGNYGGYTLGLNTTATSLQLTETANAAPAVAYWSGAINSAWNSFSGGNANNSNWLDGPAGADTHAAPGATTNVFLTANTAANLATTLGQNFEINSLTFTGTGTSGTAAMSIGGSPSTLTIDATAANGNTAGVGITTQAGAGAIGISVPIILGGSQSWTSNASTTLTVSGGVTGVGDLTLATGSTGGITLSTTNPINNTGAIIAASTSTGTITISAPIGSNVTSVTQAGTSTFTISSAFALSATNSTFVSTGSGAFQFTGGITGTQNLVLKANSTGGITLNSGSVNNTGTITSSGTGTGTVTIGAVIGSNVTSVTQAGTGPFTISSAFALSPTNNTLVSTGSGAFNFTGGITGAQNLIFNANSTGAIIMNTGPVNNAGTITNTGTGTGTVTINSLLGANVTGVTENSATSALTLGGANSAFNIGVVARLGILNVSNNTGLGTAAVTLGDSTPGNSNAASLFATGSTTLTNVANPINVVTGSSGTLSLGIGVNGPNVTYSGVVTLNNNLTLVTLSSTKALIISGGITGTGNLTTASNGGTMTISSLVNHLGTITNTSAGGGTTTFSGGIGSNIPSITQASGTNAIAITTNALALNSSGTTITSNAAGAVTVSGGVTGTANLTLNDNSTGAITISGGASYTGDLLLNANSTGPITVSTVPVNNTGSIINSGTGAATTTISGGVGSNVTTISENSATSALTISTSAITVNGATGTTLNNNSSAKVVTLSGGTTGTGNLVLNNNTSIASGITVSTLSINHTGTLTNSGTGTGSTVISAVIGANVTGVIQNSATSLLNLTGTNTYAGSTLVSAGTFLLSATGAINSSSGITINGSTADFIQTSSVAVTPTLTLTQGTLDGTSTLTTVNVANSTGTLLTAGNGGSGTLTIGTLTFGGASNIDLTANGTTMSSALAATTSLAANAAGHVLINLTNNTFWSNTTYNLITYGGGSIGGNGFGSFQIGTITGLGPRQGYTLNDTGSAIALTISGDTPVWTGALDGRWTTATLASPKNWKLLTAGTTTDYIDGDIVLFDDTATGTTTVNISDGNVNPSSTTFNNSTKNYTLGGSFGIAGGQLTKSGTGTLTINNVNTYAGATIIQNGTVVLGVNNALPIGTNLTLGNNLSGGSSTQGTLNLTNASQTIGSLTVQSDSTTANQILIGGGRILTINGNVTVGENGNLKTIPRLTMSGGGSLAVINNAAGAVFQVGANTTPTTSSGNNATVDLSGLSAVTISLNTTNGAVNVGDNIAATANSGVFSSLLLPTTGLGNTTITAASLNVGTQGRNSVAPTDHLVNLLKLGSGANVFNVNSFNVGTGVRDAGSVTFTNSSGTLTLRNAAGSGRATLSVGTGASNTGANRSSTFDVTGHSVDLLISTLSIGDGVGTGVQTNVFSMDTGTLDATTLTMGKRSDGSGVTTSIFTTTVTFGADSSSTETVTFGAGGLTLLNQQATVASSGANATLNSTLNILGGTVTVGGDIIEVVATGASNHSGTLSLNGGTLDMSGKKIGGSAVANNIDNLVFASGTLKNVGEINNGGGLTKTTAGTLTLAGANTYSGATTVKAGTLVVSGSLAGSTSVTVGDAANLGVSAILGGSGTLGDVTVGAALGNTGATLLPHAGSSSTSQGNTLTTGAVTFTDGSAHLSLELGRSSAFLSGGGDGAAGGDRSDHLSTIGAVSLNSADLDLSLLTTTGYGIGNGDVLFLIINGGGSAINGTFASLNGTPTSLGEGAQFFFDSQQYTITYQANFAGDSFTGGNDVALRAIPEPSSLFTLFGGVGLMLWRRRKIKA